MAALLILVFPGEDFLLQAAAFPRGLLAQGEDVVEREQDGAERQPPACAPIRKENERARGECRVQECRSHEHHDHRHDEDDEHRPPARVLVIDQTSDELEQQSHSFASAGRMGFQGALEPCPCFLDHPFEALG
jgi:hypothetical protein